MCSGIMKPDRFQCTIMKSTAAEIRRLRYATLSLFILLHLSIQSASFIHFSSSISDLGIFAQTVSSSPSARHSFCHSHPCLCLEASVGCFRRHSTARTVSSVLTFRLLIHVPSSRSCSLSSPCHHFFTFWIISADNGPHHAGASVR